MVSGHIAKKTAHLWDIFFWPLNCPQSWTVSSKRQTIAIYVDAMTEADFHMPFLRHLRHYNYMVGKSDCTQSVPTGGTQ